MNNYEVMMFYVALILGIISGFINIITFFCDLEDGPSHRTVLHLISFITIVLLVIYSSMSLSEHNDSIIKQQKTQSEINK